MRKRIVIFILTSVLATTIQAQEIVVKSRFLADSVKLGMPIGFSLTARYPAKLTVLFPDSTFAFTPFEFQKKIYTTTRTANGVSYDSAVYTLQTYEVDSIQVLKLPIFLRNRMDCTVYYSNTDTVFFQHLVPQLPDSLAATNLPLKTNTNYVDVRWQFNTILFAIIIGILIATIIIVWIVFGKRIRKYFKVKRLSKRHQEFVTRYQSALEKLNSEAKPELAESAMIIWKNYMEELLTIPYTKFTTKEINEHENSDELVQSLKSIDRMIYAKLPETNHASFDRLLQYGNEKYQQRLEEVKNG